MDQEKVGKFIKELRKNNKMTQVEFSEKYNVTYQAVSNWEHGKNLPDISLLKQMSKDFNVSIDDLLNGKKTNKRVFDKRIISLVLIVFLVILGIFWLDRNNSGYEFKILSANCDDFQISGSLSYDNNKTSIFINNVNYCGGNDDDFYTDIECGLYEANKYTETKISSCNYSKNEKIKLDEFLKDVEFVVLDYSRTCKIYTNNNLFLRINAKDVNGKIITYNVPLSLNEDCK